ncbi:MAG TPA: trypsin-like peptidase domain-containing protein, partial [Fimbriimonadaceae bacterium]|nr:trypsin-like peptidase domain-containing protein [Fimbriimonadaceae bacterium]
MNARKTRSGKSAYVMLLIGAVIGAVTFASIQSGKVISPAQAEKPAVAMPASNLEAPKLDMLRSLDEAFASIVDYASKAVVHIRTGGDRSQGLTSAMASGEGSGVIFRSDGYIVTNAHVVDSFDTVTVTLNDGRSFPGKVIKAEDIDIAVVKIQASDLPTVQFGNSDAVRPGQFAIAVGSPFGFENSTTIGHISAIGRESIVPDMRQGSARFYPDLIQTDASINMGNSGGPLLNVDGQVVGINTAIYSGTGGSVGIGFAIPSNQARMIADMLIEKGKV